MTSKGSHTVQPARKCAHSPCIEWLRIETPRKRMCI